tara:strand:- start:717 stop:1379 length:663 start_codon:yes stop_codon:yes gene_type:complete
MTNFWLNDLNVLFNRNSLFEIIPYTNMNLNSKLNAVFRLSIYFSLIMYFFKKNYRYLVIILIVGILTIIVSKNHSKLNIENNNNNNSPLNIINTDSNNNSDAQGCKLPTKTNPFMNPTFSDYESGNLMKACNSYDNSVVRSMEEEYFNNDLYRDVSDIFNKENSQREFYTMPVNSIINDSIKFANWCYKTPPTCGEGNAIQCAADLLGSTLNMRGGPGNN